MPYKRETDRRLSCVDSAHLPDRRVLRAGVENSIESRAVYTALIIKPQDSHGIPLGETPSSPP